MGSNDIDSFRVAAGGPESGRGADLSNWRTSPYNRWAFCNIGELVPTAAIAPEPGAASPLAQAPVSLEGFSLPAGDGSTLDLRAFLTSTATDAFVVLKDGRIAYEVYDHGTTADTPHIVMSMTKAVTGLVAGLLVESGEMDRDAPASDYVPEVGEGAFWGATVGELMDMRTGVRLDEAQELAYAAATGWDPCAPREAGLGLHAFLQGLPAADAAPGGPFSYVSANTDLLGWVLERASGMDFAALASERLWKPLGAEHAASITLDRRGAPRCAGGFSATARDLARLGRAMLDGGRVGERQVLPRGVVDDIARGGDRPAWAEGEWGRAFSFISPNMSYRGGWYTVDDAPGTYFAMGIHGQNLFVDPSRRLVVVKLSSLDAPIDYRALPLTHAAVAEITRCLS